MAMLDGAAPHPGRSDGPGERSGRHRLRSGKAPWRPALAALLLASALAAPASARAMPVTYTLTVLGGNASGSLGTLAFSSGYFDLVFEGDTADVFTYSVPGPNGPVTGAEIMKGTASVIIYDSNHSAIAQATFLPSAGIFVSVDQTNNGIGFGSSGVPLGDPAFPGDPVYPSGLLTPTGAVLAYDLTTDDVVSGYALSCGGFPGVCADPPPALPTTAGDLRLDHVNIAFAQFIAQTHPPFAAFASFDARLELERDGFELSGDFTLGAGSDGIDPVSEPVALQVGPVSLSIPAGSFQSARRGGWRFAGDAGGAVVGVRIAPLGGNAYRLSVEGNADVSGIQAPVTVGLTIGNDSGSTAADLDD
ncbi:MAG TPA: hypothetical protein VLD85_00530 [Anaeromyxobacteraceae bacterium]|nr:hypothetical protein [Anaeromyxobacteraceae bacterium]